MKAEDIQFLDIINGRVQFRVPVFQRDYTWEEEQWERLWRDVCEASKTRADAGHFLGAIVYVGGVADATFNAFQVIDGQQRLTSLLLMLTALRDHIRGTAWKGGDDSPTAESINDYYLSNAHDPPDRRSKLRLRRHDDDELQILFQGVQHSKGERTRKPSSVRAAYDYFLRELRKVDPDEVYRGISRLRVVKVTLARPVDNPQVIFESLNSTGAALTQSDLVRNYLLMGLDEEQQALLYERYWAPLEADFRRSGSSPDRFLREYVALRSGATKALRDQEIYDGFKRHWNPSRGIPIEELLKDILRFGRYYIELVSPSVFSGQRSRETADALRHARANGIVHTLLGMQIFDCVRVGTLPEADLPKALGLIESYIIRRSVVGWSSRNYWANFASVARHAQSNADADGAMSALRIGFARLAQRFPTDAEFETSIQDVDLYNRRNCHQILSRLENARQREPSPVQDYSVEHIMPQTPGPRWKEMLGLDWEEVHGTWLHRLGNLTLTAYNSTLSNRPFEEKKTTDGGFNQSAARLNEYVRAQPSWTLKQMKKRGQQLAGKALLVWPGHGADEQALRQATIADLRRRASERNWNELKAAKRTKRLIEELVNRASHLGDIVEIVETDSTICFYTLIREYQEGF